MQDYALAAYKAGFDDAHNGRESQATNVPLTHKWRFPYEQGFRDGSPGEQEGTG